MIENIRKILSNSYIFDEVKNSNKLLWGVYKDDLTEKLYKTDQPRMLTLTTFLKH